MDIYSCNRFYAIVFCHAHDFCFYSLSVCAFSLFYGVQKIFSVHFGSRLLRSDLDDLDLDPLTSISACVDRLIGGRAYLTHDVYVFLLLVIETFSDLEIFRANVVYHDVGLFLDETKLRLDPDCVFLSQHSFQPLVRPQFQWHIFSFVQSIPRSLSVRELVFWGISYRTTPAWSKT